ncbi:hypothetical protein WV31_07310 [Magnetospirillum sp. ME-1]|uniref:hypothetical protein n=1 Tax=Magnetospirillum sp. ME-1 TaxID=1639348 RepID=UPI000A17E671|nr:hypothetical protein [Magnetospirillum sp. ME-1]ARJ65472.1 hypothetical protein WV31_07310 [Magnetospirillum sp. ME-1]
MSAYLRRFQEEGPERSGLILFDAHAPHENAVWGMRVSQAGKEALVAIGPVPRYGQPDTIIPMTTFWANCADIATIAHFMQVLMPGPARDSYELMLRGQVKR